MDHDIPRMTAREMSNIEPDLSLNPLGPTLPVKSTEETLAELRRENFRLRLICFDYQRSIKQQTNPEYMDSSRLFAVEAENVDLKKNIADKAGMLRSASKMIDILKEENDSYRAQLSDLRNKLDENEKAWQEKYDTLYVELQQARQAIRQNDLRSLSVDLESNRQRNELRSRISELETSVEAHQAELESRCRELELVQSEAVQLRSALKQLNQGEAQFLDESQLALQDLSRYMHASCVQRVKEVASVVHELIKQITDAGLTPVLPPNSAELLRTDSLVCLDTSGRKPLSELATHANSSATPIETSKNAGQSVQDETGGDGSASVASLSERLNAARKLILELGNQKLRQDKLIVDLRSSHEMELEAMKENYRSLEDQFSKKYKSCESELDARKDEIQSLHQRVAGLLGQIDDLMLTREHLMMETDQALEQVRRLQREQAELRDQFGKELKEKDRTIERLNLVLTLQNGAADVTQYSFHPDDAASVMVDDQVAHHSHHHKEDDASMMLQLLSVSTQGAGLPQPEQQQEPEHAQPTPTTHRRRSETFSLDGPSPEVAKTPTVPTTSTDLLAQVNQLQTELVNVRGQLEKQITDYARLKKAYNVLLSTTNIGSLDSDAVTSLDGTKNITGHSPDSSCAIDSLAELPTVSTPPHQTTEDRFDLHGMVAGTSNADLSSPGVSYTTLDAEDPVPTKRDRRKTTGLPRASQSMIVSSKHAELSNSGVMNHLSGQPVLNMSLPGVIEQYVSSDRVPQNTPVAQGGTSSAPTEPASLLRLRDLYNLVHGLKVQLDNVRFTQHSVVEMVNRSLGTSGLDISLLFTPSKTTAPPPPPVFPDKASMLSDISEVQVAVADKSGVKQSASATPSVANATYGGTHTLLDNSFEDVEKSFEGANETLNDLRALPTSPSATLAPKSGRKKSAIPVYTQNPKFPLTRVKAMSQQGSTSFTEGTDPSRARTPTTPFSQSFAGDVPQSPSRGLGEVSMVEWQNKDLFERLARATAKLRNALEECAEVGSLLCPAEVTQYLSQFNLDQSLAPAADDQRTPEVTQPNEQTNLPTTSRSVRFDRVDPHLAPSDFAQLSISGSEGSNLSRLYGSRWLLPEASWSEKLAPKQSVDTQTSTSKAASLSEVRTSSESVMLQRYISLITHALSVLHQTVDDSDNTWLSSWTQSVTHWFQSYADGLTGASDPATPEKSEKEQLDSLLECLERVFNQHIDDWVASTKLKLTELSRTVTPTPGDADKRCSELDEARQQIEILLDENRTLEQNYDELKAQLDQLTEKFDDDSVEPTHSLTDDKSKSLISRVARMKQDSIAWDVILDSIKSAGFPIPTGHSPKDCIEALLMDWRLAKDDRDALSTQLKNTIPLETYTQTKEELMSIQSVVDTYRQDAERQRHYIHERLKLVNLDPPTQDPLDCIDLVLAELTKNRDYSDQITIKLTDLHSQLESSVPKLDFEEKQHELDVLTADLEALKSQLNEDRQMIDHVIATISPLAPSAVNRSAAELVGWMSSDYVAGRDAIDSLRAEQREAFQLLSELTGLDETGVTVQDMLEFVRQSYVQLQEDLDKLRSEREELTNMFREFGLDEQHDDVICQVEVLLSTLIEKQQALLELEAACEHLREDLSRCPPESEFDKLQSELETLRNELTASGNRITELEEELENVTQSSIPLTEHQTVIGQLNIRLIEERRRSEEHFERIRLALHCEYATEDLAVEVEKCVYQLREYKQSLENLEQQLTRVSQESTEWHGKYEEAILELNHLAASTEEHVTRSVQDARVDLEQRIRDLESKLQEMQSTNQQTTNALLTKQSAFDQLSDELREAHLDIESLRLALQAKTESAEAAVSAALAHEERANELASNLEALRTEHARCCPSRPSLVVSAQTSPVGKSKSFEQLSPEPVLPTTPLGMDDAQQRQLLAARAKKYGELKAVAFEIKEKLVKRTDKLEAALTEVARLRSVIQQDKEHASRVLEEVEDLRKQAIRKNRRIHELETELSRLKTANALADAHPVSSARNTRSSARTISELEQPRGAQLRSHPFSEAVHALDASLSLLDQITPSIDYTEFERDIAQPRQRNSSSVLHSDHSVCPQDIPEREVSSTVPDPMVEQVNGTIVAECKHCDEIRTLVGSLQNLSAELQRRVDFNLTEERSLLATLERHSFNGEERLGSRAPSVSNMTTNEADGAELSGLQSLHSSLTDVRTNIRTLHHARSRLKHYAAEMDRICCQVVQRIQTRVEEPSEASGDNLRPLFDQSLQSLKSIYDNLKSLYAEVDEPHRSTVKHIARQVKQLVRSLSEATASPSSNKENVEPARQRKLLKRAARYRRQYEELARGLDEMNREWSGTAEVLSAARSNLERISGLSSFSPNSTN